jgi:acyl-CoA-dependent ceramide synthase
MVGTLKPYYLLQTAYWCQQFLLLVLRVEKPRSDFTELVAHHLVTLWLIIWSYLFSLTLIGNAIYLTMDWSDVFLAVSSTKMTWSPRLLTCVTLVVQVFQLFTNGKDQNDRVCVVHLCLDVSLPFSVNHERIVAYLGDDRYLRHYLNLVILWSVWFHFDLIPCVHLSVAFVTLLTCQIYRHDSKVWDPENGKFLPPAMKYQIFIPIAALQLINIFWYFLIWRILLRYLFFVPTIPSIIPVHSLQC